MTIRFTAWEMIAVNDSHFKEGKKFRLCAYIGVRLLELIQLPLLLQTDVGQHIGQR